MPKPSRRRSAAPDRTERLRALDAVLPGGGWQRGTIVELMPADIGIGELQLLMPALARITNTDRHVALIAPPYIPFAPALSQHGMRLDRLLVIRAQHRNRHSLGIRTDVALQILRRCARMAGRDQGSRSPTPAARRRSGQQHRLYVSPAGGGARSFAGGNAPAAARS